MNNSESPAYEVSKWWREVAVSLRVGGPAADYPDSLYGQHGGRICHGELRP